MAARIDERQAGRPPVQAAFWLVRASLAIGGRAGDVLLAVSGVAVIGVFAYAITVTADTAPSPAGPQARRIERSMTVATVIELVDRPRSRASSSYARPCTPRNCTRPASWRPRQSPTGRRSRLPVRFSASLRPPGGIPW
jgi:hypothetical protein